MAEKRIDGWRGMRSAPRDGTDILLYEGNNKSIWTGRFYCKAWAITLLSNDLDVTATFRLTPTHWMPLPDAPKDAE